MRERDHLAADGTIMYHVKNSLSNVIQQVEDKHKIVNECRMYVHQIKKYIRLSDLQADSPELPSILTRSLSPTRSAAHVLKQDSVSLKGQTEKELMAECLPYSSQQME